MSTLEQINLKSLLRYKNDFVYTVFLDRPRSTLKLKESAKKNLLLPPPPPLSVGKQQNCAVQPTFGKECDTHSQVTVELSGLNSVTSCLLFTITYIVFQNTVS